MFAPDEIVVLELSVRLCHDSHDLGEELVARLKRYYTERQLAEILLVAGLANMYNRVTVAAEQVFERE